MQVLIGPSHFGSGPVQRDPILPWEIGAFGQVLLWFLDGFISRAFVPFLPGAEPVVFSFIRV